MHYQLLVSSLVSWGVTDTVVAIQNGSVSGRHAHECR
jgi:hypothetical protein